jgi:predicted nucleic acid-binding protein
LPDVVCDTSPLQYLYQIGMLDLLPHLTGKVIVPPTVVDEIAVGHTLGVMLPDLSTLEWIEVRHPVSEKALPLITDLGPGETEVLMLGLELAAIVVLDDRLARRVAEAVGLKFTGTLGLLLDAKRAGYIPAIAPLLDQLHVLRFRISPQTRQVILGLAGETR